MLKRIQVIAVLLASALCSTAHAEAWVYHDTLPTKVAVYVDMASVRITQSNPEIRSVKVSVGRSGEETETITVEAACAVRGIRTSPVDNFSVTQADKTMGKLVARVCNK